MNFVEIRFTDKMIQVGFPFKDIKGFFNKLKGGAKKKVFLQILE